jgi:hypothetical protein
MLVNPNEYNLGTTEEWAVFLVDLWEAHRKTTSRQKLEQLSLICAFILSKPGREGIYKFFVTLFGNITLLRLLPFMHITPFWDYVIILLVVAVGYVIVDIVFEVRKRSSESNESN